MYHERRGLVAGCDDVYKLKVLSYAKMKTQHERVLFRTFSQV